MNELVVNWVGVLAKIVIPLLVLSLGLNTAVLSPGYFWRRRGLLLRSLLSVDVLVPVVAVLLVLTLPLPPMVKIGLVLLSISPGAPFAPLRSVKLGGDLVFTYNFQVILALSAVVTLPVSLALLGRVFGLPLHVDPRRIATTVLAGQILPLLVGLSARRFFPRAAALLGPSFGLLANILLVFLFGLIFVTRGELILRLGAISLMALFALALTSLLLGHVLGGPELGTRRAVAVASAVRHPGLALLVARVNFPAYPVAPVIIAYVLAATLAAIPYEHIVNGRVRVAHGRS